MQEAGPPETIEVLAGQTHLGANHVRIRTHAFGVASGESVVLAEHADQLEQALGRFTRCVAEPTAPRFVETFAELIGRAGSDGDLEPRRRLVGEGERESQERSQGHETPRLTFDHNQHRGRDSRNPQPTQHPDENVGCHRQHRRQGECRCD